METTGIRLEIEPWLYRILIEEQEQRRQKTNRKQPLSAILLEFCTKGLTVSEYSVQNQAHSVQKNSGYVQNFQGFEHNNDSESTPEMYKVNVDEITKLKETLLRQRQELQDKDRHLASREQEIKEKENEITEKKHKALQEWNEILDIKEQSQQKSIDRIQQQGHIEQQIKELEVKKEAIKMLKQENMQLKEDVVKILHKIDQQTEKNIIFDYIVPFLPSVISIIGFFLTNRKIDNIQELNPIQSEISNIMKKLSDADRKMLSTKLEESLKAFSDKPIPDK
jgi:DNA repair exonuclease SbcCD ATPase subunit